MTGHKVKAAKPGAPGLPWSEEQDEQLRRLKAEGFSIRSIVSLMRRSESAITKRCSVLKIPKIKPAPVGTSYQPTAPKSQSAPRAGATTLEPLPSLQEPLYMIKRDS